MQRNHHNLFYVLDLVTSAQHTVMNNERLIPAVVCAIFSNFSVNSPFSFINWNLSKTEAQRHIFPPLFLLVSLPSWTACCYSQNESDCMDSNIYSAVPHIPLKRLNLSSLIVALLRKKTPCQMKRHQRQSAAPWWETWAVPPDEFSQWPPMSQLSSNDSSLYEEVRAREMSIRSNSNLPCGRQFVGRENNIKSPFSNIEQTESHSAKSGCQLQGLLLHNKANEV